MQAITAHRTIRLAESPDMPALMQVMDADIEMPLLGYVSIPDLPLHTVLGGFHLLDGYENEEKLLRIAKHLKAAWPDVQFYTGHCTGDNVLQTMQQLLGEHIQGFSVGNTHTC